MCCWAQVFEAGRERLSKPDIEVKPQQLCTDTLNQARASAQFCCVSNISQGAKLVLDLFFAARP
jgi:hypothetical protein